MTGLQAAWQAVRERPEDPRAWAALGDVQADLDQLEGAAQAYRTAIRLGAPGGAVHARLGFLLYAMEHEDEALALLSEARQRGEELPLLGWTIATLTRRLADLDEPDGRANREADDGAPKLLPPAASVQGAMLLPPGPRAVSDDGAPCSLRLETSPHGRAYLLIAEVEGVEGTFLLDTGASRTLLTEAFAARARIAPDHSAPIRAITANGIVLQPTAQIDELVVAQRAVFDLRVAVCENCGDLPADGLLGLDVQRALGFQVDVASGEVRFLDCGAAP
jgi:tetratricopeptide (TPR) repeat protein